MKVILAEKTPNNDKSFDFNTQSSTNKERRDHVHQMSVQDKRRSRVSSSSSSDDITEAIEEAFNQVQENSNNHEEYLVVNDYPRDLELFNSTIVVLGSTETIRAMNQTIVKLGARNIIDCPVSYEGGLLQYEDLLQSLGVGDQVVFVWAIETRTGDIDDQLIGVFKNFLNIFAADSIKSMMVVLWYPGSMEDLRESIEDLTEIMKRNYHYNSPLGFPVLQYKADDHFNDSLLKSLFDIQPFKITNITMNQNNDDNIKNQQPSVDRSQDIVVVSSENEEWNPVVLIMGAPGHGKSSIGNMILGGEYFQVRGKNVLQNISAVHAGYLGRNQAYATVLEAPAFYDGDQDFNAKTEFEQDLKKLEYLTHVVVAWHALELRETDLDTVLAEIIKMFGASVAEHLIFVVTYCDSGSKAKKYRSKRGISFDSISSMIKEKTQNVFNTREEPLIYFVCSKQPKDPSRKQLVNYLNSYPWKCISSKQSTLTTTTKEVTKEEDNYEEVEEEVFYPDNSRPSKSMYNLSTQHTDVIDVSMSKSLHSLNQDDQETVVNNSAPRKRPGRGRLFSQNQGKSSNSKMMNKRNDSSSRARGKSRSTSSLFGGGRARSRSQSQSNLQIRESEPNLYQESPAPVTQDQDVTPRPQPQRTRSRGRSQSRGGFLGTRSRSQSRSNLRKSRSNLVDNNVEQKSNIPDNSQQEQSKETEKETPGDPRYSRQRQRTSSMGSSLARRRGRSKSRQRRSAAAAAAQSKSSSLPRPKTDEDDQQRAPIRRSRSNWSLRSSNYRRRRRSGECVII